MGPSTACPAERPTVWREICGQACSTVRWAGRAVSLSAARARDPSAASSDRATSGRRSSAASTGRSGTVSVAATATGRSGTVSVAAASTGSFVAASSPAFSTRRSDEASFTPSFSASSTAQAASPSCKPSPGSGWTPGAVGMRGRSPSCSKISRRGSDGSGAPPSKSRSRSDTGSPDNAASDVAAEPAPSVARKSSSSVNLPCDVSPIPSFALASPCAERSCPAPAFRPAPSRSRHYNAFPIRLPTFKVLPGVHGSAWFRMIPAKGESGSGASQLRPRKTAAASARRVGDSRARRATASPRSCRLQGSPTCARRC